MKLIRVPDGISDVSDRQGGEFQKLAGLGHAIGDQKFLGRFSDSIMKDFSEIAAVQPAECGDIFHRNIILEILFNKT